MSQNKDRIIVMGGYGQVGGYISEALAKQYPKRVWAVGRNLDKAKAFESKTKGLVLAKACDLSNANEVEKLLEEAQVVIMCFVPRDTRLVEACIKSGVHYIDITPTYSKLKLVEPYQKLAQEKAASVILGVGICPGITNLMVKAIKSKVDEILKVESTMLLGVGETYGMDALDWLVDNLKSKIRLERNNGIEEMIPFRKGKTMEFLSRKPQICYPIDLADQHIVPKTLGIKEIDSRFCYDVNWVTREVALMNRLNMVSKSLLLKGIWLAQKLKIGSDDYVLQIKAQVKEEKTSEKVQEIIYEISGSDNAKMTAYIAAATAYLILEGKMEVGLHYLEEVTSLDEILMGKVLDQGIQKIKEDMEIKYTFQTK